MGVDVFFVISGYLITNIIISEMKEGRFSLLHFYERRVRRIFPALFFVILISVPVSFIFMLPEHLIKFGRSLISISVFISNFFFWSERGYFGVATDLKPFVHTWSLAVEEQFYIIFPLFLLLIGKKYKLRNIVLLSVFLISLSASWYLSRIHFETAFYLPFSRAWELLLGSSLALFRTGKTFNNRPYWQDFVAVTGLCLIALAVFTFDSATVFPGLAALVPTIGTAMVIYGCEGGKIIKKTLSMPVFVSFGLISYSLYLWHQPIFSLARHAGIFEEFLLFFIFISIVAAIFSYKFIEQPFRKKRIFSRKAIFISAASVSTITMLIGFILVYKDGFVNRYAEEDRKILKQFSDITFYNQKIFDSILLQPYKDSEKKHILLVGDSYAKDFLNIVYEGGYNRFFEFSTKQINSECGNIHVTTDFSSFIPESRQERCRLLGRYDGAEMRRRASESDEIWLVNAWQEWVLPFLPETVENLEREFGAKVRVFGIKGFGKISQKEILAIPPGSRTGFVQPVSRHVEKINQAMLQILPVGNFNELLTVLCGGDYNECRIFTPEGLLISPDGGHLTQAGAKYLAQALAPMFMGFLPEAATEN